MKTSSVELQPASVDPVVRRRRRTRILMGLVLLLAVGIASRSGLNATERRLIGIWDGLGSEAGVRFRFNANRSYRIELYADSTVMDVQEGEWMVRDGHLRMFPDGRIPAAFLPRLAWRIEQLFSPRGGMTGTLEFADDGTFRSSILRGGTWQRMERDEPSPPM